MKNENYPIKKCISITLAALLTVALCSCSLSDYLPRADTPQVVETVNPYMQVIPQELTYSEGYDPVESAYSYNALPLEGEKLLYQKMLEVSYDISPEKSEEAERYPMPQVELDGFSLTEAQVRTVVKALTDDHPEIFWLTGTMGYYSDDSTTIIQVYANYSPEEIDARVNEVRAVADEFYATVPDGLSVYERERMVHDFLIDRIEYDKDVDMVDVDNNNPDTYTVYGALVNQVSVCEGYARAFQMLMNGLGVDCVGVMGESSDQMHIWNAVRFGNDWYNVDVTWNDREETYARYIYFNVTDDYLFEDHTLSPMFYDLSDDEINGATGDYSASVMNLFVPACNASDMGYYYRESPHLADYDARDVKSGLFACAERQDEFFVFYVDEWMDFDTAVSELFVEYPQYFFDYMNTVNDNLSDVSIDSSNASYYTHKKSRIIAVELHYY